MNPMHSMKKIALFVCLLVLTILPARALDWDATPQTTWEKYCPIPAPPGGITPSRLRLAVEMSVLGGPMPSFAWPTPMGVQMRYWDRVIAQHGLPAVADSYVHFLRKLKAELAKNNQQANQQ